MKYPISWGKFINVAAFVKYPGKEGTVYDGPWVAPTTPEQVTKEFEDWDPELPSLLKVSRSSMPTKHRLKDALVEPTEAAGLGRP